MKLLRRAVAALTPLAASKAVEYRRELRDAVKRSGRTFMAEYRRIREEKRG